MSDFGSGHDITVYEFEPHIGLRVNSSEPGVCFRFFVSLCPSPTRTCLLSLSKTKFKKKKSVTQRYLENAQIFEKTYFQITHKSKQRGNIENNLNEMEVKHIIICETKLKAILREYVVLSACINKRKVLGCLGSSFG